MSNAYNDAQQAIALLKGSIHSVLRTTPEGLKNAQIGQMLGIHKGHGNQHAGHIARTLLEIMQSEGTVKQAENKLWTICDHIEEDENE